MVSGWGDVGDPCELVKVAGRTEKTALEGWEEEEKLQLLNLSYETKNSLALIKNFNMSK